MSAELNTNEKKAKTIFIRNKEKNNSEYCKQKVLDFYKSNKAWCTEAHEHYKLIVQDEKNLSKSYVDDVEIDYADFQKEISDKKIILIITATEIEKNILVWKLKEKTNKKLTHYLISKNNNDHTIFLNAYCAEYQNCLLINVRTSKIEKLIVTGEEPARRAINDVYKFFTPNVIILLGICYGIDLNEQELGMVNVSQLVTGVRINLRDDRKSKKIHFEPIAEFNEYPNLEIITKIDHKLAFMNFKNNNHRINVKLGNIVSANCIMSCKQAKTDIIETLKPIPYIGGEMESCGLFKSSFMSNAYNKFDRWLVIKSICDWGESKNNLAKTKAESDKIKDSIQSVAMENSCEVLFELINKKIFD